MLDPAAGLPAARVVYPEAGSVLRTDINLIGVASGRFGVNRVLVQLDDGDPRPAEGAEYWSRTIDIKNLSEGWHRIRVQAFDIKGMPGPESEVSFIIDRALPSIELTSHRTGDIISGNVEISGQAGDANGIAALSYSGDGGETYRPLSFKTRRGESAVNFSFPLRTRDLEDGPVIYYVKAVDRTGNEFNKPYLFFVDNHGPEVEILSPAPGEDVYEFVKVTGRVYDRVGLERLYYEWGGASADIPLRPGDPFWTVDLDFAAAQKNTDSFRVTAVDRSGNVSSAQVRLQDRRRVKAPVLVIDYPPPAGLAALPPEGCIYGHIEPGFDPEAVAVEGLADEITARSAFRISPDLIPPGRGSLKLYPRAGGITGAPLTVRTVKPPPAPGPDGLVPEVNLAPSQISVSAPEPYAWISGPSVTLEGRAPGATRLEYRLHPEDGWRPLSLDGSGGFRAGVSVAHLDQGPIHLELRTAAGGVENLPLYHPLNRAAGAPEIQIFTPAGELGTVHGNITVSGAVASAVPITGIAYSRDNNTYIPLNYRSRWGRAWFSLIADFSALDREGGALTFRVTDASGASYTRGPDIRFDASPDIPALIVNSPNDGDVITGSFEISGVAFDDDAVAAVHWRILKPLNPNTGRRAEPDPYFQQISTSQSFQVLIPFDTVVDGESTIEIYAEDMYGTRSGTMTRSVKVSTAPPENTVTRPLITDYNRNIITIRGTSSDANGIEEVQLSMDNGATWQRVNGTEEWNLSLNTAAYVDGVYSLLVRTTDGYGISALSNALINIDNTAPGLSIGTPENDVRVGNLLQISGRVQDNIELSSLKLQLISTRNTSYRIARDLEPEEVIFEDLDVSRLNPGEYILRISADDRAGNEMVVSRRLNLVRDNTAAEVLIFNPMPGLDYSGPLVISGKVTGAEIPETVTLSVNRNSAAFVEVDRYGVFRYQYPEENLSGDMPLVFSAAYDSPAGGRIESKEHAIRYVRRGPILTVDSHKDGDVITGRPWLSGEAWTAVSPQEEVEMTRRDRRNIAVKEVLVSFDNGRSFSRASGREKWKFRLETGDLPLGSLPVLIRANYNDGRTAVRRLILTVDTNPPLVETLEPAEDSTHRDNILVYGTASDDFELGDVEVSLRPGDKAGYAVPGFIQGLYLDANILGATWVDGGIGLSFFKDNVKLQFQAGAAPATDPVSGKPGRYIGAVAGFKLLANIFYLPFDYFFGPDWSFFSMSLALGANFSYFSMDPAHGRNPLVMGAFLGQWEFARVDLSYFFPQWKYVKTFSFYVEPIFWFASSDVQAEAIPRVAVGARINIF
jgi:hypothetical protein